MSAQSLYFLLVVLLSRYTVLPKMKSGTAGNLVPLVFSAVMIAPLVSFDNIFCYSALLIVVMVADSILVRGSHSSPLRRVIATAFDCVVVLVTVNLTVFDRSLSQGVVNALISVEHLVDLGGTAQTVRHMLILSIGFLLTAFEANYLVLSLLRSYPGGIGKSGGEGEGTTLQMGRLIGILERIILYLLIITGNITTIGFIIAAKALARFKELEDKDFAEYFLVGTLSSVGTTLVISLWIKAMLT